MTIVIKRLFEAEEPAWLEKFPEQFDGGEYIGSVAYDSPSPTSFVGLKDWQKNRTQFRSKYLDSMEKISWEKAKPLLLEVYDGDDEMLPDEQHWKDYWYGNHKTLSKLPGWSKPIDFLEGRGLYIKHALAPTSGEGISGIAVQIIQAVRPKKGRRGEIMNRDLGILPEKLMTFDLFENQKVEKTSRWTMFSSFFDDLLNLFSVKFDSTRSIFLDPTSGNVERILVDLHKLSRELNVKEQDKEAWFKHSSNLINELIKLYTPGVKKGRAGDWDFCIKPITIPAFQPTPQQIREYDKNKAAREKFMFDKRGAILASDLSIGEAVDPMLSKYPPELVKLAKQMVKKAYTPKLARDKEYKTSEWIKCHSYSTEEDFYFEVGDHLKYRIPFLNKWVEGDILEIRMTELAVKNPNEATLVMTTPAGKKAYVKAYSLFTKSNPNNSGEKGKTRFQEKHPELRGSFLASDLGLE